MKEIVHTKGRIYYSMGEVAEMFDVNPSLIRFWEKKFDILKLHKNKKGNRMFTPGDVDNLKLIYHLVKEKGMTLAGAEKVLKGNRDGTIRDMEIADRLLAIKAMLVEIREELKADGEVISPEGYLEEEGAQSGNADDESDNNEAAEEPEEEAGFVLFTEEVRVEVVTDGSSPWTEETEEEEPEPGNEDEEPIDEPQRQAAMEELRNIKSILDGWDEIDAAASNEPEAEGIETEMQEDSRDGITEESPAASEPETAAGDLFGMDDHEEEDADPWEEAADEPAGRETIEPETSEADLTATGDLFGTDLCTTFSEDDREAIERAQEKEEPQRPAIYEQTLF